jgi:hypothetical protein
LEYPAVPAYAGADPSAIDPVFVQLIRNLAPDQAPVLRIGGDSTDWTWWPVRGMHRPAGVSYTLTARWIAVTRALVAQLKARLILGIDFEADSGPVAAAEAHALIAGVGGSHIEGLELGNEPELYGSFKWGRSSATGRPRGYDFAAFNQDFTRIGTALPMDPLAGPAAGSPKWFPDLGRFLSAHPRVAVATLHRYPLQVCGVSRGQPNYPTLSNLLSDRASRALANSVESSVKVSHARGVPLRIDEMNTISCGTDDAVGKSFASALWSLDALFEMARVGLDGVNIHTYPGATYELFTFSRVHGQWRAVVEPEYYGLLMFAQAAPAGSQLLSVSQTGADRLEAWATQAPGGTIRVVTINDGTTARIVAVRAGVPAGTAVLERLEAPALGAQSGVTLAGQSFGAQTATGVLAGPQRTESVTLVGRDYVFRVAAASAVMLTMTSG